MAQEILCPSCGMDVAFLILLASSRDEAFCPNCGAQVIGKCQKCYTPLTSAQRFCMGCGSENPIFREK